MTDIQSITSMLYLSIMAFIYFSFIFLFFLSIFNGLKNGVPLVSSFDDDFIVMKKYLGKYNLNGKKLIDLGSGIGKATRFFYKCFETKTYGIEIDLGSHLIAKVLNFFTKTKIQSSRGNYLKADISNYDFIYIYLFPGIIERIEEKIRKEAKPGTTIFSNAFKFKKHTPIDIFKNEKGKEEVYVYVV